jgi:hypothetical protein
MTGVGEMTRSLVFIVEIIILLRILVRKYEMSV